MDNNNIKIFVNGCEIEDALLIIDSLNHTVSITTWFDREKILDTEKIYIKADIYGDIDIKY